MNPREQILKAELKTVQVMSLSHDRDVARAAVKREQELQSEINDLRESLKNTSGSPPAKDS